MALGRSLVGRDQHSQVNLINFSVSFDLYFGTELEGGFQGGAGQPVFLQGGCSTRMLGHYVEYKIALGTGQF